MINLYLDIDGVILRKDQGLPKSLDEFLEFVIDNFNCFWLTTHCKGDNKTAIKYLSSFFPINLLEKMKTVKPTNWETLKTEAINFDEDFVWIDDYPFEAEKAILNRKGKLENLIQVDLSNENELQLVIGKLKGLHTISGGTSLRLNAADVLANRYQQLKNDELEPELTKTG